MVLAGVASAALLGVPGAALAEPVQIGLMTDMGVPDGFVGAVIVRPQRHVHVHAGVGHNTVAPGLRAGVQLVPWQWAAAPYAALEIGHYFRGRPGDWAQGMVAASADMDEASGEEVTVEAMGYTYGNAHLGLRLGSRRASFYVQGGLSRVQVSADLRRREQAGAPLPLQVDVHSRSEAGLWAPSARFGMEAYF
jgi:hypothetical protein